MRETCLSQQLFETIFDVVQYMRFSSPLSCWLFFFQLVSVSQSVTLLRLLQKFCQCHYVMLSQTQCLDLREFSLGSLSRQIVGNYSPKNIERVVETRLTFAFPRVAPQLTISFYTRWNRSFLSPSFFFGACGLDGLFGMALIRGQFLGGRGRDNARNVAKLHLAR